MAEFKFKVGDVVTLAVALIEPRAYMLPRLMIVQRTTDECTVAGQQVNYRARIAAFDYDDVSFTVGAEPATFSEIELAPLPADAAEYQKKRQEAKNPWRKDMREVTESFKAVKAALNPEADPSRDLLDDWRRLNRENAANPVQNDPKAS